MDQSCLVVNQDLVCREERCSAMEGGYQGGRNQGHRKQTRLVKGRC